MSSRALSAAFAACVASAAFFAVPSDSPDLAAQARTAVGPARQRLSPCTRTIDLRGRTAVPGLIDNHNHIVLLGMRPGYDTRLESAASMADVQATLKARAKG